MCQYYGCSGEAYYVAQIIEFNNGHPDVVGKQEVGDIEVQVGVTNGVAKVK